ncbi:MAG TPA: electron transfer flavoprotein subunit alpha/FixB family protein [Longimicrobiales bacterium]|nr:electron transfer flavoprotein subunit alpha/FixB family protein [Longimicrobiales bacterium]
MGANVLALVEFRDGAVRRVSYEVLSAARTVADAVGGQVHALAIGPAGIEAAAPELGRYGADRVRVVANDAFGKYTPEGFTDVVAEVLRGGGYYAAFFGATAMGKDLAPRVAARVDLPLAGDATELDVQGGELYVTRPVYAGKALVRVTLKGEPRLVSLRPNVFLPQERPASGEVETVAVDVQPDRWRVRVREFVAAAGERPDVAEAPIVVAGGRGMRGPENWQLLEDLCEALGPNASLGASRAVVDAGWRPHGEQVGQTGKTVSPQLYIAVGISGAIQHLAGMRTAKTIVAINKDPDAPIFKVADYGIVGDAFEILPRLTKEIRALREGG